MTAQPSTTTIRVNTDTRDRLNTALREDSRFKNVDDLVAYLLDEEWKRAALADWDRFREEDPEGWRAYLEESEAMDAAQAPVGEPPYESDDPEWLAAGGAPLTKKGVA